MKTICLRRSSATNEQKRQGEVGSGGHAGRVRKGKLVHRGSRKQYPQGHVQSGRQQEALQGQCEARCNAIDEYAQKQEQLVGRTSVGRGRTQPLWEVDALKAQHS